MADRSDLTTVSIRIPYQIRELVAEACYHTDVSLSAFMGDAAIAAAGVIERGKNLKLPPEWLEFIPRPKIMTTITISVEDLQTTKWAAKRMMLNHTQFVVWAITLFALGSLGEKKAKSILTRIEGELQDQ